MLKVLLVVALIAVVVWVLVKLMLRRLDGGGGEGGSRPRTLGPDDDPDFLRGLDRKPKPGPKPDDD
ncbi:hypothetical protein L2K70_20590 [Nocardioides KLBMP 9356]|uniref:Uncharacterized protein n=1 Tax=Nocardioides potassii TaxID=2911371 RepID=A0ABS9HFV1_9ACTN|nr:hypothetical protein [Nocardioides potassii]MCF6380020.1 hypothetical protein [Nocardioides potassii]